jgi:hypothetical protein
VLGAFAGSALADDRYPPPEKKCPADSKEECKNSGGEWKYGKCIKKYDREKECKKFKAIVRYTITFEKDKWGNCKRKEDKKIIACYNPKGKPVDENACKNKCDDKKDDDKKY